VGVESSLAQAPFFSGASYACQKRDHRKLLLALLRYDDRRRRVLVVARLTIDDHLSIVTINMEKPTAFDIVQQPFFFHENLLFESIPDLNSP
jgi:hypothetical protein